jgi:phosphohistidine phosphatase
MELYLIRHGIAVDRSAQVRDEDRTLTPQGREKTQTIAQRLKACHLEFDRLLSSPLCRAQETAVILQQVGLAKRVEVWPGLRPGEPLQGWLDWCSQEGIGKEALSTGQRLALVGHEPDLSSWAVQLLWGEVALNRAPGAAEPLQLKKAGILGLTLPDTPPFLGRGQLFWLTPPRLLLP